MKTYPLIGGLTAATITCVAACGGGSGAGAPSPSGDASGGTHSGSAVGSSGSTSSDSGSTSGGGDATGSSATASGSSGGAGSSATSTGSSTSTAGDTGDGAVDGDGSAASDAAVNADGDADVSDAGSTAADAPTGDGAGLPAGSCPAGTVRIPSKNQSFMMGFDPSEAPGTIWACYLGKHKVTFTYDYCMDAKLVTQQQFSQSMGFNPSKHQTTDPTLPVDSETWYDAMLYCNKKSQMDGLQPAYSYGAVTMNGKSASNVAGVTVDLKKNGYRIPTNAEYEYAERANTVGLYFFSATKTANITGLGAVYAWYSANSGGVTQPVGKLKPNPWGLYDIVGNLFEWENDWEGPYVTTDEVDPLGPMTGTGCGSFDLGVQKMAKGGSWHTDVATHMRISYHFKWAPAAVHPELGFRCVATAN